MKSMRGKTGSLMRFFFAAAAVCCMSASAYAAVPGYWVDDCLVRTRDKASAPDRAEQRLQLSVARNEYEARQIVLAAASEAYTVRGVTFTHLVSDSGARIDKSNLTYNFALYEIAQETITGFGDPKVGSFPNATLRTYPYSGMPDPLSNDTSIAVKAGLNQPIYVTAFIPKGTPAGTYRGRVTVHTTLGDLEVPMSTEVFDVDVPDSEKSVFTCLNWDFCFGQGITRPWNVIKNYYGAEPYSKEFFEILTNFVKMEADHRQNAAIVSAVFALEDANTTVDKDGNFTFDWSLFDRTVDCYLSSGKIVRLVGMHFGYGNGSSSTHNSCYRLKDNGQGKAVGVSEPYLTKIGNTDLEDTDRWYAQYLPALTKHLLEYDITRYPQFKGTGKTTLFDIWLQHICDEPAFSRYYIKLMSLTNQYMVKRDADGNVIDSIKTLDAENNNILISNEAIRASADIWVPKPTIFEKNRALYLNQQKNHGDELWNYVCIGPDKPWLNRFLVQADTTYPLLFWYFAKEHITGYLHYAINGWCLGWWGDGDTYVTYPDKAHKTMMSSIRFCGQRDGMEDYELFAQAEKKFPEQTRAILAKAVIDPSGSYIQTAAAFRALRNEMLKLASGNGNISIDSIRDPEIRFGPKLPDGAYYTDNKDPAVNYSNVTGQGIWKRYDHKTDQDSYLRSVHYTQVAPNTPYDQDGASLTYTFKGTGIGVMLEASEATSDAYVTVTDAQGSLVDGQAVDGYSPNRLTYHTAYEKTGLPYGTYTVKVSARRGHREVDQMLVFDAFVVHTKRHDGTTDLADITVRDTEHGYVSASEKQVKKGTDVTLTVHPDAGGYYCKVLTVNGKPFLMTDGSVVLKELNESIVVDAVFAPVPKHPAFGCKVALNNPGNGNPDPNTLTDGITAEGAVSNNSYQYPLPKTPFEATVDLGTVRRLGGVTVYMQNYYRHGFEVWTSADGGSSWSLAGRSSDDDAAWTMHSEAPHGTDHQAVYTTVTFAAPADANRLKISVNNTCKVFSGNPNIVNLYEIVPELPAEPEYHGINAALGCKVELNHPGWDNPDPQMLTDGISSDAGVSNDSNSYPLTRTAFETIVRLDRPEQLSSATVYMQVYYWHGFRVYTSSDSGKTWTFAGESSANKSDWKQHTLMPSNNNKNHLAVYTTVTFKAPVTADCVKIEVSKEIKCFQDNPNIVNLYEIELNRTSGSKTGNVALNKPVSVSSYHSGTNPQTVTNGNIYDGTLNDATLHPVTKEVFELSVDLKGLYMLSWMEAYIAYTRWQDYELYSRVGNGAWTHVTGSSVNSEGKLCTNSLWNMGHGQDTFSMVHNLNTPLPATELKFTSCKGYQGNFTEICIRELTATGTVISSTQALEAEIARAEATDLSQVTASGATALTDAVNAARAALGDAGATVADRYAALNNLIGARAALRPVSGKISLTSADITADGLVGKDAITVSVTGAVSLVLKQGTTEKALTVSNGRAAVTGLENGKTYVIAVTDADGAQCDLMFTADLQAPIVDGVTEGEIVRSESLTVTVRDPHLVSATLNGIYLKLADNAAVADIIRNGSYTLIAKDVLGNTVTRTFEFANKDELRVLLSEMTEYPEAKYTAATYGVLTSAAASGRTVLDNAEANAETIRAAVEAIRTALAALIPAPAALPKPARPAETPEDTSDYTDDAVKTLTDLIYGKIPEKVISSTLSGSVPLTAKETSNVLTLFENIAAPTKDSTGVTVTYEFGISGMKKVFVDGADYMVVAVRVENPDGPAAYAAGTDIEILLNDAPCASAVPCDAWGNLPLIQTAAAESDATGTTRYVRIPLGDVISGAGVPRLNVRAKNDNSSVL